MSATFSATAVGLALGASNGLASNATSDVTITPSNAGWVLVGADAAGTGMLANASTGTNLSTSSAAQTALTAINSAIQTIASDRGNIGAVMTLQAASNVEGVQVQNLTSAEDSIMSANIPEQVTNLSEYSILNQSGISALAQANSSQQSIFEAAPVSLKKSEVAAGGVPWGLRSNRCRRKYENHGRATPIYVC